MSLADIRQLVLDDLDSRPAQSEDFIALLDRFINRGLRHIGNDAAYLFERDFRIETQADVFSNTSDPLDRLEVDVSNARVLKRRNAGLASTTGAWLTNQTWNGRWLEITAPDGTIYQRKTRDWWQAEDKEFVPTLWDYVSLETPWLNSTDSDMAYRIYTPEYYLPHWAVELRGMKLWDDPNVPIEFISRADAEQRGLTDFRGRTTGYPLTAWQGRPFQLQPPTLAPQVSLTGSWAGPENAGSFEFMWTIVHGKRYSDFTTEQYGIPIWESGPSPISARITTTNLTSAINIKTPDIDQQQGFQATNVAEGHSGYRKRLWVRRITADQSGSITRLIESPKTFMLLTEIAGNVQDYPWDGGGQPDYMNTWQNTSRYSSLQLFPTPNRVYSLHGRVTVRPQPLVDPSDNPQMADDGMDLLVLKTLEHLYAWDEKPDKAANARAQYIDKLKTLTKRYSAIAGRLPTRQLARVQALPPGARSKSVRYTDPT